MKITRALLLGFAIFALLSVLPAQAAEKTEVTATFINNSWGILPDPPYPVFETDFIPGTITSNGPEGSQIKYFGFTFGSRIFSSDDRIDGWLTMKQNAIYHADGSSNTSAKWRIDLSSGDGYWEGDYTEQGFTINEFMTGGIGNAVLHGYGSVDGLLLKLDTVTTVYYGGAAYVGEYTGYILDPHAPNK